MGVIRVLTYLVVVWFGVSFLMVLSKFMDPAQLKPQLTSAAIALEQGNVSEAKAILAPLHQSNPHHPEVIWLVSDVFIAEAYYVEAVALLQKAIKRRSNEKVKAALLEKATSVCAKHDLNKVGLECAQQWVREAPASEASRFFLAVFLCRLKRYVSAAARLQELVNQGSTNAWVYKYLAEARMFTGEHQKALPLFERGIALAPEAANFRANFLYACNAMEFMEESRVSREHLEYAGSQEKKFKALTHQAPKARPPKLKLGFVSGEFRCHSISYFFLPLLRGIDPERYEIYCYSDVEIEDQFTEQIKAFCTGWRETKTLQSAAIYDMVVADRIDVLVDLNGYTGKFRYEIFVQKAAPVQLNYLGYPNTTGFERMDYRLTDNLADPEGESDPYYSETLLRLPGGFLCFEPDPEAPEFAAIPAQSELPVRFGSFNAFQKINDAVIDVWAEILTQVENATFLCKSFSFKENEVRQALKSKFEARGVSAKRLILVDHTPSRREHLALYSKVDLHLDTFPYNGTTTTFEALWQGVPTITYVGNSHRSRVGRSIMTQAGMPSYVGQSRQEYVAIAVKKAQQIETVREERIQLRERLRQSPLMSVERFAREFSDAIEFMYAEYMRR